MSSECSRRVRLRDCSVRNRTSVSTTGSERRSSSFSGESKKNPPNGVRVAAVDFEPVRVRAADELLVALNDLIDGHDVGGTEDKEDVVVPQEQNYMGHLGARFRIPNHHSYNTGRPRTRIPTQPPDNREIALSPAVPATAHCLPWGALENGEVQPVHVRTVPNFNQNSFGCQPRAGVVDFTS